MSDIWAFLFEIRELNRIRFSTKDHYQADQVSMNIQMKINSIRN